jgi:hypothetical protein
LLEVYSTGPLGELAPAVGTALAFPQSWLAYSGGLQHPDEPAHAQSPCCLEGEGLVRPGEGLLEGSEGAEDGEGEAHLAEGAVGRDAAGEGGGLSGGVVGEAGHLGKERELVSPAGLELEEEVAEAEGSEVVVGAVVVEEGEVGAPEGLLVRVEAGLFEEELLVQHGARVLDRIMALGRRNWRVGRHRKLQIANCRLQIADCKLGRARRRGGSGVKG